MDNNYDDALRARIKSAYAGKLPSPELCKRTINASRHRVPEPTVRRQRTWITVLESVGCACLLLGVWYLCMRSIVTAPPADTSTDTSCSAVITDPEETGSDSTRPEESAAPDTDSSGSTVSPETGAESADITTDAGTSDGVVSAGTETAEVTLNSEDLLVFKASSDGKSYTVSGLSPAFKGVLSIPAQHNGKPVTGIDAEAFASHTGITGAVIPGSVTLVGERAFYRCTSMKTVRLSEGTGFIDKSAFAYSGLNAVELPDSVYTIEEEAFAETSLKKISIGQNVSKIGKGAFRCKTLESLTIDNDNDLYFGDSGALYSYIYGSYGGYGLLCVPARMTGSFKVINGASVVVDGAVAYSQLDEITVPPSMQYFLPQAFTGGNLGYININEPLNRMTLEDGCINVDGVTVRCHNCPQAVEYCKKNNITYKEWEGEQTTEEVTTAQGDIVNYLEYELLSNGTIRIISLNQNYKGEVIVPETIDGHKVGTIGKYAFNSCLYITYAYIPSTVTELEMGIFSCCTLLKEVDVDAQTFWIRSSMFRSCDVLERVRLSESIQEIGENAFLDCPMLSEVNIPGAVSLIGKKAFMNCTSLKALNLPESNITEIGASAFENCSSLCRAFDFPAVTVVGQSAFKGSGITGVSFGSSKLSVEAYAFENCTDLKTAVFTEGITAMKEYVFSNTALENFVIPESVNRIELKAFMNTKLTSVHIGKNVSTLSYGAFYGSCTEFSVDSGNTLYYAVDGVLYMRSCDLANHSYGQTLTAFPAMRTGSFTVPEGTELIYEYAFSDSQLTEIILSNTVKGVDKYAFIGGSIKYITMPESVQFMKDDCISVPDVTVRCVTGSTAYAYCVSNGIKHEELQ